MKLVSNFNDRFKEAFGGRSVTEFANEIGVSKQAISAYLNGVRKPKKIVAEAIACQLNVSPAWLLGYDVPKESALASLSNSTTDVNPQAEEFLHKFMKLSKDDQDTILMLIDKLNKT